MKTTLVLTFALLCVGSSRAQVLRPAALNGAVLGGVAGAIIGNNSGDLHHNAWRGAAYGAGAGLLIGSIVGDAHDRRVGAHVAVADYPRTYVYRNTPAYYGYGYYGRPSRYHRGGSYGYISYEAPLYTNSYYGGSDYAGNGLLLGALAGAIIGNNSGGLGHNAWRGAAYGGAAGYILGSIAESNARYGEEVAALPVVTSAPAAEINAAQNSSAPAEAPEAAPAKPVSSMAAANNLFGR